MYTYITKAICPIQLFSHAFFQNYIKNWLYIEYRVHI